MKDSIYRDKYIELSSGKRQQLTVPDRSPAHLPSSLYIVTDDVTGQTSIDAFVKKNLHAAASMTRSLASSRKAMTMAGHRRKPFPENRQCNDRKLAPTPWNCSMNFFRTGELRAGGRRPLWERPPLGNDAERVMTLR